MFNKDLFLALCKKYNVELSGVIEKPMIKVDDEFHEITEHYVKHIFGLCQVYFDYYDDSMTTNSMTTKVENSIFYLYDDYGIAC